MIIEFIRRICYGDNYFADRISELNENRELKDLYKELQRDILDTVHDETEGEATKSDIWEVVIREGLYQNLTENPSVALEFLLITAYGPTIEYKERLNLANDHSDLIVLIGLSALVNDTVHQKNSGPNNRYQSESRGKVKLFNKPGGFGFIETDDADEYVFFHMEDISGPDLEEGQEVKFDMEETDKGPRATNITRL